METIYLVGGAVRDKLLGRPCNDKDYVVVGAEPDYLLNLGMKQVGVNFPVFLCPHTGNEHALARTESSTGEKYGDFDCYFGKDVTLVQDLSRRDLTINAIAECPESGILVDPFNGVEDIKDKVLRHVSPAFAEDPLRVLRLFRFWAQLGPDWTIATETIYLVRKMVDAGLCLAPERVWIEMEKALKSEHPALFFNSGYFEVFNGLWGVPQNPVHHPEGCVGTHTVMCMEQAVGNPKVVFAALCHDFGKPVTHKKYGTAIGHEAAGAPVIERFCRMFKVPNAYKELALLVAKHHTKVHSCMGRGPSKGLKASTIMSLFKETNALGNPARFLELLETCECDSNGRGTIRPYPQKEFLFDCLQAVQELNTKSISTELLASGASGTRIGQAIYNARLSAIKGVQNGQ